MTEPFKVTCPACGTKLRLKSAGSAGQKVTCPKCEKRFVLESTPEPNDDFGDPESYKFQDSPDAFENDAPPLAPGVQRKSSKKKRRKQKPSAERTDGNSRLAFAGIAFGMMLLVAVLIGAYLWLLSSSPTTLGKIAGSEFQIELNADQVKVDGHVIRKPELAQLVRKYSEGGPVQLTRFPTPKGTLVGVGINNWPHQDRRPDFDLSNLSKGIAEIRKQNLVVNVVFDEAPTYAEIKIRREKIFGKEGRDFADQGVPDDVHERRATIKITYINGKASYIDETLGIRVDSDNATVDGHAVKNLDFTKRLLAHVENYVDPMARKYSNDMSQEQRLRNFFVTKTRDGRAAVVSYTRPFMVDKEGQISTSLYLQDCIGGIDFSRLEEAFEELRLSNIFAEVVFADGSPTLSMTDIPVGEQMRIEKNEFVENTRKDSASDISAAWTTKDILKFAGFGVAVLSLAGFAWFKLT